jgi:hypothetical protein
MPNPFKPRPPGVYHYGMIVLIISVPLVFSLANRLEAIEAYTKQNPDLSPQQRVEYVQNELCN